MMIPVKVSNCDDFPTNIIIQSVHGICVNEAITDPYSGFDGFFDFTKNLRNKLTDMELRS